MLVIIPAAAPARRESGLSVRSLLDVGGRTLLEEQVRTIQAVAPAAEVVVVGGRRAREVRAAGWPARVVISRNYRTEGACGSVALAARGPLAGPVVVWPGDVWLARKAAAAALNGESSVLFAARSGAAGLFGEAPVEQVGYGGGRPWSGVLRLSAADAPLLRRAVERPGRSLVEMAQSLVDLGVRFAVEPLEGVVEVNTPRDHIRVRRLCD